MTASDCTSRAGALRKIALSLEYIPKRCRWDPENPPVFGWSLCCLFAFASSFTVANLYYNHPILNILAEDFGVSYESASRVPTLMQAGYAVGMLFVCPIADIVRRRPLTLSLIFIAVNLWLGLCLTRSFSLFLALSFLVGLTTVTPQLMLPLVAELAPPRRRATMISVVFGGLFTGVLIARILSGVVTNYTSWRIIYFIAFGLQYILLILLFLFLPDYPSLNDRGAGGTSYLEVLWSIVRLPLRHPILVQTSIIALFANAVFISYWTTLTGELSSPPYNFSSIFVGLFALIGLPPFIVNPFFSHFMIDRYHPSHATILGLVIMTIGVVVGTFVGPFNLSGLILEGLLVDFGMQFSQTASRTQLVLVEPKMRNRVNTVYMLLVFVGQLVGSAVGNRLYAEGGWLASGYANIAFSGAAIAVALARGPHESGWFGWRGGWSRNSPHSPDEVTAAESQLQGSSSDPGAEKAEAGIGSGPSEEASGSSKKPVGKEV